MLCRQGFSRAALETLGASLGTTSPSASRAAPSLPTGAGAALTAPADADVRACDLPARLFHPHAGVFAKIDARERGNHPVTDGILRALDAAISPRSRGDVQCVRDVLPHRCGDDRRAQGPACWTPARSARP
jgi:hypothetical protein